MDGNQDHHVKWDKPSLEMWIPYFCLYVESRPI
jgi:hypothetical protein